jgi:hypothetical protein
MAYSSIYKKLVRVPQVRAWADSRVLGDLIRASEEMFFNQLPVQTNLSVRQHPIGWTSIFVGGTGGRKTRGIKALEYGTKFPAAPVLEA